MSRIAEVKLKLKDLMRSHFSRFGLNKLIGDIFVECLFAKKPLSFKELSELTGYSEASISLALKPLTNTSIFRITTKPGSKKKYVEIQRLNVLNLIEDKLNYLLNDFLPNYVSLLKSTNDKDFYDIIDQMNVLSKILEKLKTEINRMRNQNERSR